VSLAAVSSGTVALSTRLTLAQWALFVLPIGVCTALSLAFANIAYVYLSLSFIQMIKAFAPVVTFVVLVAFGLDRFDPNLALALLVIVAGCFTASSGEVHAKSAQLGLVCMLVCEVAEAFRSAGLQYLLASKSFTLFDGLYYFSPATLIFLAGLVYVFEWEDLKDADHLAAIQNNPLAFLCASTLGFFVNVASLGVIQCAGSLTLKIISQLKNVAVIVAAVVLYDDVVTALETAGYAVAMCGFAMYQHAKWMDAEFAAADAKTSQGQGSFIGGGGSLSLDNSGQLSATVPITRGVGRGGGFSLDSIRQLGDTQPGGSRGDGGSGKGGGLAALAGIGGGDGGGSRGGGGSGGGGRGGGFDSSGVDISRHITVTKSDSGSDGGGGGGKGYSSQRGARDEVGVTQPLLGGGKPRL
jgi:drug/metabolite transporter (DMT)-like permease